MNVKRSYKIEGVLHPIEVRFVTQKYLNRITASKGETVLGCYVDEDNLIYVAKEQTEAQLMHTLLHELKHVFDAHVERMGEEGNADAFASLCMRLFNPKLEELLK